METTFLCDLGLPAGDIEYKYAVNGFADQENLIDDMQNGADCAPVTDYAGYANCHSCWSAPTTSLEAAPSALSRSWT